LELKSLRERAKEDYQKLTQGNLPVIYIGMATCGQAAGAGELMEIIPAELKKLKVKAEIVPVGCIGTCCFEPLVDIQSPGQPRVCYHQVDAKKLRIILRDHLVKGVPRSELALGIVGEGKLDGIPNLFEHPMLKPQVRIVLKNCGIINPEKIEHYLARDGFVGLERALAMTPEQVIEEMKKSGLRGRGGAGFSTGQKWEFARKAKGKDKYIICNADEGDPGAFMDRSLLEGDPFAVLEGMVIGGYAIGASHGYIYCRAEYPLAIKRLKIAIRQMEEHNLLGDNILGSGFNFHLKIKEGAGAFVCGEETAMIASIEGRRGMPRQRPPFPAQSGVFGMPTNINNVETFGNVPHILKNGAEWYASFGTEKSKGTKTFALTGKVKRTGLIEVPMGIKLKDIIFGIGGGILGDKKFKAAQTGGPSGGCIPAEYLDLPIDYEHLAEVGSIMGSGGLVIMDEDTCMVDLARYFLTFTQSESCGKCTPCRIGTRQMLKILEEICAGKGKPGDIELLQEMGDTIKKASLCGLGQTSPNPVLTTIKYFREEYEEHIKEKKCRSAVCPEIVKAPCKHTCPANVDAPRYIRLIEQGDFENARKVIQEQIPFAWVCGLVCFHPCETRCKRGNLDEPIAIRVLKRCAVEFGKGVSDDSRMLVPATGKRIAIIGSGPAGLTSAYYLRKLCGHEVTVFEALPKPGGMLRYGIPDYRLPQKVLDAEINRIKRLGVEFKTNQKIKDIKSLKKKYDAVFVAVGAHNNIQLGIPGEELPGVLNCVSFLRDVKMGKRLKPGQDVAVIGGGNSAIDAARTALRLGAKNVFILYRRTEKEMPANPEELEDAKNEGVNLEILVAPVKVQRKDGRLLLSLQRMKLGDIDKSGRPKPVPVAGSEFAMEFDQVITAIGQKPGVDPEMGLELEKNGTIKVNPETLETSVRGIFAGGDAVLGPASVIEAIAMGRRSAIAIDRFLGGKGMIEEKLAEEDAGRQKLARKEETGERRRERVNYLPLKQRLKSFKQVELGYTRSQACREANRCLQCDLEEK